jgi:phage tail-like protein
MGGGNRSGKPADKPAIGSWRNVAVAIANRNDPYLNFNYLVEIEQLVIGGFSEVTGLQVEIDVQEFREGGVNDYIHKLPGPARYPSSITLKRGLTDATALWDWQQQVVRGQVNRKNGSIILLDAAENEKWRWDFFDAFPVKWTGPDLRASSADIAIELLELNHRGITRSGQ